jgi:hypothetical protein
VRGITSPSAGHSLFVALISGAEVVAAIAKRGRMRSLNSTDARQTISDFQNHFQAQYRVVVALTQEIVDRTMGLAPKGPEGYDAVQLTTRPIRVEYPQKTQARHRPCPGNQRTYRKSVT